MKKVLFILLFGLLLVGCSNTDELESTIDAQGEKIEALETEVAELQLELSEKDLETSLNEMDESENDVRSAMLNNIIIEYQDSYEGFNPEVAVDIYNEVRESEDAEQEKERILNETDDQEMYSSFFKDIVELEELFE